jgi:hypothetical protein
MFRRWLFSHHQGCTAPIMLSSIGAVFSIMGITFNTIHAPLSLAITTKSQPLRLAFCIASQERFELPTDGLEGRCSIRLSYWDIVLYSYFFDGCLFLYQLTQGKPDASRQLAADSMMCRSLLYPAELLGHDIISLVRCLFLYSLNRRSRIRRDNVLTVFNDIATTRSKKKSG